MLQIENPLVSDLKCDIIHELGSNDNLNLHTSFKALDVAAIGPPSLPLAMVFLMVPFSHPLSKTVSRMFPKTS
jgi:hypothetical protein